MWPARSIRLASLALAFFPLAGEASAQSRPGADAACPAGYVVFDAICLNESTGDVVNQRSARYGAPQLPLQCQPAPTAGDPSCPDPAAGEMQ